MDDSAAIAGNVADGRVDLGEGNSHGVPVADGSVQMIRDFRGDEQESRRD
jgi:hypothetical protein